MPSVNVVNAPERMRTQSVDGYAPGRNAPGKCARWVYFAIGGIPNVTPLPSAISSWYNAPLSRRHAIIDGKTKVPKGAVVALGPTAGPRWPGDVNWMYGDVCIAAEDGIGYDTIVECTDSLSGLGIIGQMTIRERMRQTGRGLLGYLSSYGGWTLLFKTAPAKPAPAPAPIEKLKPAPIVAQEAAMLYQSKQSKKWYLVREFTVQSTGSKAEALLWSRALKKSVQATSVELKKMIADTADRRQAVFGSIDAGLQKLLDDRNL